MGEGRFSSVGWFVGLQGTVCKEIYRDVDEIVVYRAVLHIVPIIYYNILAGRHVVVVATLTNC